MTATLAKVQGQEARTEAEKVEELIPQYRAHGLAVAGAEATLKALSEGQVEELLISTGLEDQAATAEGADGVAEPVPMPELLVTEARKSGARVTFIQDPSLLQPVGGVGAFPRWRDLALSTSAPGMPV